MTPCKPLTADLLWAYEQFKDMASLAYDLMVLHNAPYHVVWSRAQNAFSPAKDGCLLDGDTIILSFGSADPTDIYARCWSATTLELITAFSHWHEED